MDFGDGRRATGATVSHVYPFSYVSDEYPDYTLDTPVTLTVTGPTGTSTATVIVTVFDGGGVGSLKLRLRKPGQR